MEFDVIESPSHRELWSHTRLSHVAPPLLLSGLISAFIPTFSGPHSVSSLIRSCNESMWGSKGWGKSQRDGVHTEREHGRAEQVLPSRLKVLRLVCVSREAWRGSARHQARAEAANRRERRTVSHDPRAPPELEAARQSHCPRQAPRSSWLLGAGKRQQGPIQDSRGRCGAVFGRPYQEG